MKKIIFVSVLLFVVVGSCLIYLNKRNIEPIKVKRSLTNEQIENIKGSDSDEYIKETKKDITNDVYDIDNTDGNANQDNLESNIISESYELKEKKGITEKPIDLKEKTTEQTPWSDLGISESDYYNQPMWSWATLDFTIREYITYEQTRQACINYGNALEDIISFSCYTINSYSGAYLGEMLKIVK